MNAMPVKDAIQDLRKTGDDSIKPSKEKKIADLRNIGDTGEKEEIDFETIVFQAAENLYGPSGETPPDASPTDVSLPLQGIPASVQSTAGNFGAMKELLSQQADCSAIRLYSSATEPGADKVPAVMPELASFIQEAMMAAAPVSENASATAIVQLADASAADAVVGIAAAVSTFVADETRKDPASAQPEALSMSPQETSLNLPAADVRPLTSEADLTFADIPFQGEKPGRGDAPFSAAAPADASADGSGIGLDALTKAGSVEDADIFNDPDASEDIFSDAVQEVSDRSAPDNGSDGIVRQPGLADGSRAGGIDRLAGREALIADSTFTDFQNSSLAGKMVESVQLLNARKDNASIVIHLNPREYGNLKISLTQEPDGFAAVIRTDDPAMHSLMNDNIGVLRQRLQSQGLEFSGISIVYAETGSRHGQAGRQNEQGQPQNSGNARMEHKERIPVFSQSIRQSAGSQSRINILA